MREDLKVLLPGAPEAILDIYIRKATTLVKNYLNNDRFTTAYIQENFSDAVIDIVVNAYSFRGKENIKSMTQGARSVSYGDNTAFCITDSVAALLPMPYIRMC